MPAVRKHRKLHDVADVALRYLATLVMDAAKPPKTPSQKYWHLLGDEWAVNGDPVRDRFWVSMAGLDQTPLTGIKDLRALARRLISPRYRSAMLGKLAVNGVSRQALEDWFTLEVVDSHVRPTVKLLITWLRARVSEFREKFPDSRSANEIDELSAHIGAGFVQGCRCERTSHSVGDWKQKEKFRFRVRNAVWGTGGLKAKSVVDGLFFEYFCQEFGLLLVNAPAYQCPCGARAPSGRGPCKCQEYAGSRKPLLFEGSVCPGCFCAAADVGAPLVRRDYLVIAGTYAERRTFRCPARAAHFYFSCHCFDVDGSGPRCQGDPHDVCSLKSCELTGKRHPARTCSTWFRHGGGVRVARDPVKPPPDILPTCVAVTQQLAASKKGWEHVVLLFRASEDTKKPRNLRWRCLLDPNAVVHPSALLERLFVGPEDSESLTDAETLQQLCDHKPKIEQALGQEVFTPMPTAEALETFVATLKAEILQGISHILGPRRRGELIRTLTRENDHDIEAIAADMRQEDDDEG